MDKFKHLFVTSIIGISVLYGIQFLIFPIFFDSTDIDWIFHISTAIFMLIVFLTLHDKLRFWLLSGLFYTALIFLYHPPGAYGIGMPLFNGLGKTGGTETTYHSGYDRESAWFEIVFIFAFLIIIELLVWCIVKLVKMIRARR